MKRVYRFFIVLGLFLLIPALCTFAQVSINADSSAPDPSAGLDVNFSDKGFLPPRMTFAECNAIANPVEGLMVYCTNCNSDGTGLLLIYEGGKWQYVLLGCTSPVTPVEGTHISEVTQILWNWNSVPIAIGYKWNTTSNFTTATDVGISTSYTETGLTCQSPYTRYVWAYNACGQSSALTILQSTSQIPFSPAPTEGVHIPSPSQIVWNWNVVTGATGYKWSANNDYSLAVNMGISTSKTETNLTCGTAYTRYAWAYNECGFSTPVTLTQTTVACCGNLTISHVAGVVAPVTKTTTYGSVTGIPGEPLKCWITSNLGSDHQASAVSDATEPSAGWYWQFNRKQGYKHDGTFRIPNTAWITSINESSDWLTANDPCNIELGAAWRIPTYTEWYNVDNTGGWTNWNGPWDSWLTLHAAGYLVISGGSLLYRGSRGGFWSSTQFSSTFGWYLYFSSGFSIMNYDYKAYGFSLRCLRDWQL